MFSEREPGGGEADVSGSGAVFSTEGDKLVERSRQVPAEPRLHSDAAQLLFGLLLLRAALHRGNELPLQCICTYINKTRLI